MKIFKANTKTMYLRQLLLSEETRYRIPRHLLFWITRFLFIFWFTLVNYYTMNPGETKTWEDWLTWNSVISRVPLIAVRFIFEILYCYTVVYWLFPKYYRREKYISFGLGLVLISILQNTLLHLFVYWVPGLLVYQGFIEMSEKIFSHFIMWMGLPTCLLLIAFKILKDKHQKEIEKTDLIIENTNAELLFLKAQIHPHFLFNTINNIYSFTLNKSPIAAELLAKLTHILRYMTQECATPLVDLDKEFKILNDYIRLESVRYGKRLKLFFEINGDSENKMIAPLLMIPFIENSFKHGASKMLKDPMIKINIQIQDDLLVFNLFNNTPLISSGKKEKNGLGLSNVTRRLQLLYPNKHHLKIESGEYYFCVKLTIPIEKKQTSDKFTESEETTLAYQQTETHGGI